MADAKHRFFRFSTLINIFDWNIYSSEHFYTEQIALKSTLLSVTDNRPPYIYAYT